MTKDDARIMTAAPDNRLAERQEERWAAFCDAAGNAVPKSSPGGRALFAAFAASAFVHTSCVHHPQLARDLIHSGDLLQAYNNGAMARRLAPLLASTCRAHADASGEQLLSPLQVVLRQFRRREMVRIAVRDLAGLADLDEIMADLSALAAAILDGALDVFHERLCTAAGVPRDAAGAAQRLVVLGMGKLGAGELNFSSDVDLIFAFPAAGETTGGRTSITNEAFFTRLGRQLLRAIGENTADGFVFRTDMRLRPYGDSGPLVAHFDALADYYQTQGRDWERYAMIKARPISGPVQDRARLGELLRNFTYRKYIDFSVIQSLRDMKALINREVARRELADNIKLGGGGIREIEFIAQAFQLIRGGRDPRFQTQRLAEVLGLIDSERLLPDGAGARLWEDYRLLRNTEHALQAWRDQQTQQLPGAAEDRERLAQVLGYPDWADFTAALAATRARVQEQFAAVAAPAEPEPDIEPVRAIWLAAGCEGTETDLAELGYGAEADAAGAALRELLAMRPVQAMTAQARERLDQLMPLLIGDCGATDGPAETLRRINRVLAAVARRSVYLTLLSENPGARQQLVRLCAASPWIAGELAQHPALLDELLDPDTLYHPPDREGIARDLNDQLRRIPTSDLEGQMEALRYFRRAHALRVAAAEITGALPLMQVSDYLTWLAEAILTAVLDIARTHLGARHGNPGTAPGAPAPGFLILGYGKLGGIELAHGSDLDLVFLHDAQSDLDTDGEQPLSNEQFFIRLGQRIIHILNTRTASGTLYEVDMRLRPSGNSGLPVSSLTAFERYQRSDAWIWEHQALVRARAIAGDPTLAERFGEIRRAVLCRPRDRTELAREVRAMRDRMRSHLGTPQGASAGDLFDLKQDPGGIVDIEFMVQFAVLAESHRHPDLTRWTDNIRILGDLEAAGVLCAADTAVLREAYKNYRMAGHRLQLQGLPGRVAAAEFADRRAAVTTIWKRLLGA